MELIQLEQFKAIAESNNITRAAEKLFVTQSALSKAMYKLEEELGVKLFDRTKNSVSLNVAGELALTHVEKLFAGINKMKEELAALTQNVAPIHLNFCSSAKSALWWILPIFNKKFPAIITEYFVIRDELLLKTLLEGNYEIAFAYEPLRHPDIFYIPLCSDILQLRVPLSHPLAKRDFVHIGELNHTELLVMLDSDFSKEYCERIQKENHVKINFRYERDYVIYSSKIESCRYASFSSLTEKFQLKDWDRVKYLPIKGLDPITFYIAYRKDRATAVKPFLDYVREDYKSIADWRNKK